MAVMDAPEFQRLPKVVATGVTEGGGRKSVDKDLEALALLAYYKELY